MTADIEMDVAGRYLAEDSAERARRHLRDAGIEPVEVERGAEETFEVKVPVTRREEAVDVLTRMEEDIIGRF